MSSLSRQVSAGMTRDAVLALLREAARVEASEIHFKVPCQPMMRTSGKLHAIVDRALTARDTMDVAMALASLAQIEVAFTGGEERDFSFGVPGLGRFRVSAYRQRGTLAVVVQVLRLKPPRLEDLHVAPDLVETVLGRPGLHLVAGRDRGSLLHALVGAYNLTTRGHLVLLEAQIAWLHRDDRAVISHREVGGDVPTFGVGIRQAIKVGADQIVVGDIPDATTADAVLSAAEAGVCILAGVAAPAAGDAVWWITRLFDGVHRVDTDTRLGRELRSTSVCNLPVA